MKKIFAILLSLALLVGLGVVTAAPVGAATEYPSISPTSATYDLNNPAEVTTTVTMGEASSLDFIRELDGTDIGAANWNKYGNLVVIEKGYLSGKLTYVGDSITLILDFDVGVCVLTITATGTTPSISPTSATWVFGSGDFVSTTIDWGEASTLNSITGLTPTTHWQVFEDTLVIKNTYLMTAFADVGDYVTLVLNFDQGVCLFTITAVGPCPSISPESANWICDGTNVVTTTITWGAATPGTLTVDEAGDPTATPLTGGGTDYELYENLLVITSTYLNANIPNTGDVVILQLEFDACNETKVLFTITNAGDVCPSVSPDAAVWDITETALCCSNVTVDINWCTATNITSIVDVTAPFVTTPLTHLVDYWIVGDVLKISGCPTSSAWHGLYCRLDGCIRGARLLKLTFNDACNCTDILTINAGGYTAPSLSSTALSYNLDLKNDTSYTYVYSILSMGSATGIKQILHIDKDGASLGVLTEGPSATPYDWYYAYSPITQGYTLLIMKSWLQSATGGNLQDCGDEVRLKIYWYPDPPSATTCGLQIYGYPVVYCPTYITVTATGTSATLKPATCEWDLDNPVCCNVTTEITWGPHATNITSISCDVGCGSDVLTKDVDYWFVDYSALTDPTKETSDLTISGEYLCDPTECGCALKEVGDVMVLTIEFDECEDGKLTIKAVGTPMCFIATAAGADAPQLDILREFRDEVMRPNKLGAELVSLYYETSPPIAEFISQNEALKAAVRVGLIDPIAAILNWSQGLWS